MHPLPLPQTTAINVRRMLDLLIGPVPIARIADIADTFFAGRRDPEAAALRFLHQPALSGLLDFSTLPAHRFPKPTRPYDLWQPGQRPPDVSHIAHLAYLFQTRWSSGLVPTACVRFKRKTLPGYASTTHHLLIAAVFFHYLTHEPDLAATWKLDTEIARRRDTNKGIPLPDAMVLRDGTPVFIEVGGSSYGTAKLIRLYQFAEQEGASLELW